MLRYDSSWTDSPSALCRQYTEWASPQTLSYCNRNLPAGFTVCSILAIANIADYIETLPLGQIILIGTFLMVFIHLCLYIRHRKKPQTIFCSWLICSFCFALLLNVSLYILSHPCPVFLSALECSFCCLSTLSGLFEASSI